LFSLQQDIHYMYLVQRTCYSFDDSFDVAGLHAWQPVTGRQRWKVCKADALYHCTAGQCDFSVAYAYKYSSC